MKAIITVKLARNPKHNPLNKITGCCPANPKVWCTDVTGEHHSYVENGYNGEEIIAKAKAKFKHITRIEYFEEKTE